MTRSKGYSLWFMPCGEVRELLAQTILRLSKEHSTPRFEPHVTLLGELLLSEEETLSQTLRLSSLIRPQGIRLGPVDYLDEYFRCLFVRVEETEAIMNANASARTLFNCHQDPRYIPHLSLLYGRLAPDVKQRIIASIGRRFDLSFEVRSIHVIYGSGEPKNWYRIREFPLA